MISHQSFAFQRPTSNSSPEFIVIMGALEAEKPSPLEDVLLEFSASHLRTDVTWWANLMSHLLCVSTSKLGIKYKNRFLASHILSSPTVCHAAVMCQVVLVLPKEVLLTLQPCHSLAGKGTS